MHVEIYVEEPSAKVALDILVPRIIGAEHTFFVHGFRDKQTLLKEIPKRLKEFGIDKLADVLDSEEGGIGFDDLHVNAMLAPGDAEALFVIDVAHPHDHPGHVKELRGQQAHHHVGLV